MRRTITIEVDDPGNTDVRLMDCDLAYRLASAAASELLACHPVGRSAHINLVAPNHYLVRVPRSTAQQMLKDGATR